MISIKETQQIILQNNPHGYYSTYMQYEQSYWSNIPSWILKQNNITNVLDIGCAYGSIGLFTKFNTNADLYCIDFMKYMSDELIEKYDINYQINNIETDAFPFSQKYDLIIFTEILEHLNYSPITTLEKIANLLTDNGVIMLSTPSAEYWGKLPYYNSWKDMPNIDQEIEIKDQHIYQFNLDELKKIIKIVGLKIDKMQMSSGTNGLKHFNMQLSKE